MTDTVLVTGIGGFIAKHVALELLNSGYRVRGTVRDLGRADAITRVLAEAGAPAHNLEFVAADLTSDESWTGAAKGCRFVQHIASPFPLVQPRGREDLTPSARDGTLRVLKASSEAERIVMTSSIVAMMYRAGRPAKLTVRPDDWSDPEWSVTTPYIISKTRAEQAAWAYMRDQGQENRLSVVNPGLVLGPSLDGDTGTSLDVIALLMKAAIPALPPVTFSVVDVRDVARVHVAAMTAATGGQRLLAGGESASFADIARLLKQAFPDRAKSIPTSVLPAFMVRLLANFDPSLKTLLPDLGCRPVADSSITTQLTGVSFRQAALSIIASAESLIRFGKV